MGGDGGGPWKRWSSLGKGGGDEGEPDGLGLHGRGTRLHWKRQTRGAAGNP